MRDRRWGDGISADVCFAYIVSIVLNSVSSTKKTMRSLNYWVWTTGFCRTGSSFVNILKAAFLPVGVNFINILLAHFEPIFWRQKLQI